MSILNLWNGLVTLASVCLVILLPVDILFDVIAGGQGRFLYTIVTLVFIIDLALVPVRLRRHRTSRRHPATPTVILADVAAAIPFGILPGFRFLYVLQLLKLLRVTTLMRRAVLSNIRYSGQLKLCFFIFWLIISAHWLSCGWLWIRGMSPDLGQGLNYLNALYWTVTTLTSVGYGDITPSTSAQMIYAMVVEVLGFSVFGYIIGVIAGIFSKKHPAKQTFLDNLEKLETTIHYRSIPVDLQSRITDYYRYVYEKRLGYDETQFLASLPNKLRREVALQMKKDVIEMIPLFKDLEAGVIAEIALNLKPLVLTPGDYLFKIGDTGTDMFFIIKGEIEILPEDEKTVLTRLSSGDFFGEIALFRNTSRTATAKAADYSDVYSLNKAAFNAVVERHPDIRRRIEDKAGLREKRYMA